MAGLTYEQLMAQQTSGGGDADGSVERGMTFEELQAQVRPASSSLAKGFGNAAMLVDMALNLPSDVLGIGANIAGRIGGLLAGGDRRENAQSAQRIAQEAQEVASKAGLIRDPAKKLMSALGYGEAYDTGAVGGAMESVSRGISKFGEVVEKGTGGALLKEDVEDLTGEAMTLGGPHIVYTGGKALLKKAVDRTRGSEVPPTPQNRPAETPRQPTPDDPLREPPYTRTLTAERMAAQMEEPDFTAQRQAASEAPYRSETQPEIRSPEFDRTANLQQQAYELMQSGASLRKVESVLKSKSKSDRAIMEAAMEELRVRRASAGEAFNRASQGETLGPETAEAGTPDFGRPDTASLPAGRSPIKQGGGIDQDLLGKLGLGAAATTAGLYAYARPDQQEEIGAAALALGGVIAARGKLPAEILRGMPERALGPVLAEGKYTLKTLDRLPQNRTEFSPAQVRQELNRPGTAAGEKAVLEPILAKAEAEGRKVSAEELVSEFRKATGDHTLTPKITDANADYGLNKIRNRGSSVEPTTTLWRFPETMHVSRMNHFADPQYFGHTRSFLEDGIEHVMEIQSDLAQNVRKVMTPEEQVTTIKRLKELETGPKQPRKDLTATEKKEWQDLRMSLLRDDVSQTVREGRKGLESDKPDFIPLTNVVKNAPNRLIRETLGQAAARGDAAVRFATADTVAKVEGWSSNAEFLEHLQKQVSRLEQSQAKGPRSFTPGEWARLETEFKEILPEAKKELSRGLIFDNPGHQSLYDRYAKETTTYLKSLGGKEVTDAQGHTWLEVPTGVNGAAAEPRPFGGRADPLGSGPINMYGGIKPELAVKLGLATTGMAIGGYLAGDEKIAGALIGGIGGLAATRLPALGRSIGKVISPQQAFGSAVRISAALGAGYYLGGKVEHPVEGAAIASSLLLGRKFLKSNIGRESDKAINVRNGNLEAWETIRHNTVRDINKEVPDPARREAISEAIQVGARNSLAPNERAVYDLMAQMNAQIGKDAVDAKVLKSLRSNYITSIVEFAPTVSKSEKQLLIDKILGRMEGPDSAGPGTRFARARKYDTFAELNRAIEGTGMRIKTKDVGEIFDLYTKSMRKAIEDRILTDFHKAAKAVDGLPYVAKADSYGRYPPGFRKIDHPQLDKLRVHPEAYDGLRTVLENYHPDIVTAALYTLSMAVKRSQVFGSLFHAKSLGEVYALGMGTEMLPRPGDLARPKRIIDEALKKFHEGGLGDHIEGLNRNGLKLEVPDDVSTTIIGDLGKLANSQFDTKLGTAVTDKIDFVNKKMDKITWDYMHAGVKSALALDAVAKFKKNNAELHAMNPEKYPLKSLDEIYTEAARYANDATGGLDWFRIATEAKTELGREVAMHFASPRGRKIAQILLFAPDWGVSTLRAGFNSFGKSETGFRGLLKPTNAVDMYRRYALRSAALWLTLIQGIQYAMTGTSTLENKDPTRIQFKDGTSLQPGKHSAEAVHAMADPVSFAMNKLGFLPSIAADVAAARYGAGPLAISGDSPTKYLIKKALPFTASPLVQSNLTPGQRVGRSVSGALGVPIYGFTPQQKLAARQKRMREAAQKRGER